jgi:AcrR family transcriptional regulator
MGKARPASQPDLEPAKARVRGVTKNTAEARRKILDSATFLFGRQGFARTGTEQIAEHAGYGQSTIFFHFKTKAGLLEACLEEALARASTNLVPADTSGTLQLIERLDRAFDDHPTAEFMARMLVEFGQNSTIKPVYAAFHDHVRQLIAAELERESGVGGRRAYVAAAAILSMMVGIHTEQRLETARFALRDFHDMLINVTQLLLQQLGRPDGVDP